MSLSKLASEAESATGLSRWQLAAILIGTPVVVGATAYYFWPRTPTIDSSANSKNDKKTNDKKIVKTAKIKPSTRNTVKADNLPAHVQAKNEGNMFFKDKKYEEAIKCYTKAIAMCTDRKDVSELATFYQNRAAANEMLNNMENVIEDCSSAINLNKRYVKALMRRAKAHEKGGDLASALADITAVCIMEQFENESSLLMTDKILKQQSKKKAKDFLKSRPDPKPLPSKQFIKHYFMSFVRDPFFKTEEFVDDDVLFSKLNDLCLNNPNQEEDPRVNLVKGTIEILKGNIDLAEEFLNKVMSASDAPLDVQVNALVKLGTIKIHNTSDETSEVDKKVFENALELFEKAITLDPNNPDVYIHRAQLYLMDDKTEQSLFDLNKCSQLAPDFASAVAQKLYVEFRIAVKSGLFKEAESVLTRFKEAIQKFPTSSEVYSLYAQSLMDKGDFDEAEIYFTKAIETDPQDANLYVHRGILKMQQTNDGEKAVRELEKAVSIDPKCQFALEMLGSLEVQKGNLEKGIKCFESALEVAHTESDCAHLFSLRDAAEAQLKAARTLGFPVPSQSGGGDL